MQDTEFRGIYYSFREAKAAARGDLLTEWDRDFFVGYEEDEENSDADRRFEINAECPEGETMRVYVEEYTLPPRPGTLVPAPSTATAPAPAGRPLADISESLAQRSSASAARAQPSGPPTTPTLPSKVYIILESTTEHHTDRQGRTKVQSKFAYTSLREANAVAYKVYCKKHLASCEEEDNGNDDSETGCFKGSKMVARGRIDT
ncbi:hypothetical protein I317_07324 [Kwoniella heveanensis CBS 569]|nr:hypothetical protein I317_07324 [Kwoniella heveanensis CBS 569]